MHPAWTEDLATQHVAQLQAAAATRRHGAASDLAAANVGGHPAQSITQRVGWALVQVGLRLALHRSAQPPAPAAEVFCSAENQLSLVTYGSHVSVLT